MIFMGSILILLDIGGIIYFHYFPEEQREDEDNISTE